MVPPRQIGHSAFMKPFRFAALRTLSLLATLLPVAQAASLRAQPSQAALAGFLTYSQTVEARLAQQHHSASGFLAMPSSTGASADQKLRAGELLIEKLTAREGAAAAGSMLHHWRGTAFVPGARAADFERLLRDFNSYPRHFAPQVLEARVVSEYGDRMQATMRVRQHHVLTVVMDTAYEVRFGRVDTHHGYSVSRSTRIAEIDSPGTGGERALSPAEEHGFLWAINTYWSFEERDGGLYLQIESISLTRSVPRGLGWAVRPYVESIPRESLQFTLQCARNALRN